MVKIENTIIRKEPIFYNINTGAISKRINDVIDWTNVDLDYEGLYLYLRAGYCNFNRTPVSGVKLLEANQSLERGADGQLIVIEHKEDLFWNETEISGKDALESLLVLIKNKIVRNVHKHYVLPLSGGIDSRILGYVLRNEKVHAFTYSLSERIKNSFEVINAASTAQLLNMPHSVIPLNDFNIHLNKIVNEIGCEAHAHGMYHESFYSQIRQAYSGDIVVTGYLGDVFAGSKSYTRVNCPSEISKIFLSYGTDIPENLLDPEITKRSPLEEIYESIPERYWKDPKFCTLKTCQVKSTLLSYLYRTPKSLGFDTIAPFMDTDIIRLMLSVNNGDWKNREWQYRGLERLGLKLDEKIGSHYNTMDYDNARKFDFAPLRPHLFESIVKPELVSFVNNNIGGSSLDDLKVIGGKYRITRSAMYRLGIKNRSLQAYYFYLILKPLERILEASKC